MNTQFCFFFFALLQFFQLQTISFQTVSTETKPLQKSCLSEKNRITEMYKNYLKELKKIQQLSEKEQKIAFPDFFIGLHLPYEKIVQQIYKDYQIIKRLIKKEKKDWQKEELLETTELQNMLHSFYKVIKKHRTAYQASLLLHDIEMRWKPLVNIINQELDIAEHMDHVEIQELGRAGLRILKKVIEKDLKKVEHYQNKLHTDWINLKLANYVLIIDLTRLRNAALFHPFYTGTNIKLLTVYPR